MKITIKLSETNNALLNRVVKEEKVGASEFANNTFLDKFLPVSEKLGIEAGFILQEYGAGTLDAWLVKQSRSCALSSSSGTVCVTDSSKDLPLIKSTCL